MTTTRMQSDVFQPTLDRSCWLWSPLCFFRLSRVVIGSVSIYVYCPFCFLRLPTRLGSLSRARKTGSRQKEDGTSARKRGLQRDIASRVGTSQGLKRDTIRKRGDGTSSRWHGTPKKRVAISPKKCSKAARTAIPKGSEETPGGRDWRKMEGRVDRCHFGILFGAAATLMEVM
jgi:hypothetical protein